MDGTQCYYSVFDYYLPLFVKMNNKDKVLLVFAYEFMYRMNLRKNTL